MAASDRAEAAWHGAERPRFCAETALAKETAVRPVADTAPVGAEAARGRETILGRTRTRLGLSGHTLAFEK